MSFQAAVKIGGILLDVEGTTTSISFVYKTLFPFARLRLESSCANRAGDPAIEQALAALRVEYESESAEGPDLPEFGDGSAYAQFLMDQDRKSTALKSLQGIIWEAGYRNGELVAHLFDDVVPMLRHWKRVGIAIRIFSSGSVLAQKLLFAHTARGDLTPLIDGYHDTNTGPKRTQQAYQVISGEFGIPAVRILFLSDIREELDAAQQAGMVTGLMQRPGNAPCEPGPHVAYPDFNSI